jgi:putative transposase
MGLKNNVHTGYLYFLTLTVVDWVDVFTRPAYRHILIDSLKYCQQHKELELYAWCLMSNHLHLIAGAKDGYNLSNILRDFKKFSSKAIKKDIQEENESRKDWLLNRFAYAAANDIKTKNFRFWQDGNEAKELHSNGFMEQKLQYIHQNPVAAEIVAAPEHYLYSSALNYAGQSGLLDVILLE